MPPTNSLEKIGLSVLRCAPSRAFSKGRYIVVNTVWYASGDTEKISYAAHLTCQVDAAAGSATLRAAAPAAPAEFSRFITDAQGYLRVLSIGHHLPHLQVMCLHHRSLESGLAASKSCCASLSVQADNTQKEGVTERPLLVATAAGVTIMPRDMRAARSIMS